MKIKRELSVAILLSLIALLLFNQVMSLAQPTDLLISEYIEGTGNNKALEIFNGTDQAIDLQTGSYNIQFYFDGSPTPGLTIALAGTTILAGDTFVLAHSGADSAILAAADQTDGGVWFDGNDAVALRRGDVILDVVGQIGFDPGSEWGAGDASTRDNTLRRKSHIEAGFDGSGPFDPAEEWNGFPLDTFDGLDQHDPSPFLVSTSPISGATEVPVNSLVVANFTEPVTVTLFDVRYNNLENFVPGSYRAQGNSLIFTPDAPMLTRTTFIARLMGIEDLNGNPFVGDRAIFGSTSNYIWEFTTEVEPSLFPRVSFAQADYTVNEDGTEAVLTVVLNAPSNDTISVDVASIAGSATETDFVPLSENIIFSPGTVIQTIGIGIIDDLIAEPDETFTVALSNPQNVTLGEPNVAAVTIVDNDAFPTVYFSAAGYTVNESAGEAPISVTLSVASGFPITVDYATTDGTATAGDDYAATAGRLDFIPGQRVMTFAVPITNDAILEADETISLILSNPTNATLGSPGSAAITILDDDGLPLPEISFELANYSVVEGNGQTLDVVVVLSRPGDGSVSVEFNTVEGSATAADFVPEMGVLVFPADSMSQTISIQLVNDDFAEIDETFSVVLSNAQNATLVDPTTAAVTIQDDDAPGAMVRINEIDSDQTGSDKASHTHTEPDGRCYGDVVTDTREFVELYDGGAGNAPLDGYVVVFYDGSNDTSYAAFDLDGFFTNDNGFFVLGNAAVSQAGIVFPDELLQDGEDAVALYQDDAASFPNGTAATVANLIDAIVYETGNDPDSGLLILLNPGEPVADESEIVSSKIKALQRCPNGSGGLRNTSTYVQALPDPGVENGCISPKSAIEIGPHTTYLPLILR